jgi:peptidoglycan/LPS O-acetylase OafA/YrhL
MKYRREIDGLRAIAVLPVILFHAGFETFGGGFVGVDVFFVISGYLITTIILAELEQGEFSIANFYERRARRILPALFLVVFACIPFAWLWLLPVDMKDFSQSLAAVSIFTSNVLFWRESGYFDTAAEFKPLLHTWSLGVEEQFYVFFPLLLAIFWRFGKHWILSLLVSIFAASLALSQWWAHVEPAASFFLLPTRVWELLIGAFAAFYLSRSNRTQFSSVICEAGGWLGLTLIVYAIIVYSKTTPFPGIYALVPAIGAVSVILFVTDSTSVGKLLGNKIFVGVGLISYSAYLWHQPLFAFARHRSPHEPSPAVFAMLSGFALILAYFSWRYVETKFRNREKFDRRRVFIGGLIISSLLLSLGVLGHIEKGFPEARFTTAQLATIDSAASSTLRSTCHFPQNESSLTRTACRYFSDNTTVAVMGNSHATELAYSLAETLVEKNVGIAHYTMSLCPHNYNIDNEANTVCGKWHQKTFREIISDNSIEYVILSYRNESYLDDDYYRKALVDLSGDLIKFGRKVILVLQAPLLTSNINKHLTNALPDLSLSIRSRSLNDWRTLYSSAPDLLRELDPKVMVVDPADLFCEEDYCYASIDGVALYFDDNHMSISGSRFVAERLKDLMFDK